MSAAPVNLPPDAREALHRARAHVLSYGVQLLAAPDGRTVAVLGETHLKLPHAQRIGRALVAAFDLRGVETFPRRRVLFGRALGVLIEAPRLALRLVSLGLVRGSTITDARRASAGTTFLLEDVSPVPTSLHVASVYLSAFFAVMFAVTLLRPVWPHLPTPLAALLLQAALLFQGHMPFLVPALLLRGQPWSWILYPPIAILTARDRTMAEGTLAMLRAHPEPRAALIVLGRAHLRGYTRILVDEHHFARLEPAALD
jgi:hypothetical protein